MNNFIKSRKLIKGLLILLPLIAAVLFVSAAVFTSRFNSEIHTVKVNEESDTVAFSIDDRGDSTSSWQKVNFDLDGAVVDLNAQTFDGTVINNTVYQIRDWSFILQLKSDCFFNNAWCGTEEIHQYTGTQDEKVQTLDLRNYEIDSVDLAYRYDGDLLIPLQAGDFVVYHPSETDGEIPLEKNSQITMGFILYFLDRPSLSDCTLSYQYSRNWKNCTPFRTGVVIMVIWLILLDTWLISRAAYKVAMREMEMKKSGISAMSDIYSIIYIIDVKKNELIPVVADKQSEKLRPKEMGAQEQLRRLFEWDCTEAYKDTVLDFCDLDTLAKRVENRNTIVCEYISRNYGWCQLRFFAMDRNARTDTDKFIFAIQVIDEEKSELEALHAAVEEKTENIIEIRQKVVVGLANIIENRDNNTGGHVKRTSDVISIIMDEIQSQGKIPIDADFAGDIVRAAPMHDVGKISIDSSILCKPGRLTGEEYAVMKTHSEKSGEIVKLLLEGVEEEHFVATAFNIARFHHERWDGAGYPDGLKGSNIPIEARIMAIADVYDALVSKRCYKEAMSFEQAYRIMMEGMGTQFDPQMKEVFSGCHKALEEYYSNSSE